MKYSLPIISALLIVNASAATIIRANTPGSNGMGATNANIVATFGDNISLVAPGNAVFETSLGVAGTVGTPNIDLTWSRSGTSSGANAWQYHSWGSSDTPSKAGGGALQMDGSAVGSTYSITFAPTVGNGVVLNGFNFIGDTGGDIYQYDVQIVRLSDSAVVFDLASDVTWTTVVATGPYRGAPQIDLNYAGAIGETYRLDIIRTGGAGSGANIAIDNLSFDQIPEPSVALLGGFGLLALLRRRRA